MNQNRRLGDLQLAIMQVLWEHGEAAASDVHKALLEERGLAVTTIKTMLRKLEEYGCVEHRPNGRQFIYRPAIAETDIREGMVEHLVQRMFSGDSTALVNHLIQSGEVNVKDLDQLKALVSQKRKRATK